MVLQLVTDTLLGTAREELEAIVAAHDTATQQYKEYRDYWEGKHAVRLHARPYEGEARPAVVIVSDDCLCRHCAALAVVAFEQPPVVACAACGLDRSQIGLFHTLPFMRSTVRRPPKPSMPVSSTISVSVSISGIACTSAPASEASHESTGRSRNV